MDEQKDKLMKENTTFIFKETIRSVVHGRVDCLLKRHVHSLPNVP